MHQAPIGFLQQSRAPSFPRLSCWLQQAAPIVKRSSTTCRQQTARPSCATWRASIRLRHRKMYAIGFACVILCDQREAPRRGHYAAHAAEAAVLALAPVSSGNIGRKILSQAR
eukprot:2897586-Pleurochrysis_carterae.AAC.1